MFFGLCNSLATFQAYMNHTFRDFIDEEWLIIYMNDMLIHTTDNLLHWEWTKGVLQCLQEQWLALKLSKCSFNTTEVKYLGLFISPDSIHMDSIKLAAIKDWLPSKNVKKVRCFIEFCNFYKKFIPGFSDLAKTLLLLTHKNTQWQWTSDHAKASPRLKTPF